MDRRGVASVDAYIAFSHRFGSSAQTPLGHAQSWIRREAYHASNPYRHLLWLVQTQTLVFRLRAQTSGASVVVRLYELGGWASGVHQKTMQTMGIRLLRLWAGDCLASVSVAIFVVYMNGCSMGVEVLNHHPLKFREEANGVWRIRQLAQCFHHSSLALLILAQRVRGIYSHT